MLHILAEQLPIGTLGIYKCAITSPANGKAALPFLKTGLYLYQNASWSYNIGLATLTNDGVANVIVDNPHCFFGEASTSYPYIVKEGGEVVIYNPSNADKMINITILSM